MVGHDVTEVLGAVEGSPAGAVGEARDEGHEDMGQGSAGREGGIDAEVDVLMTGQQDLGSNLFWTLTN